MRFLSLLSWVHYSCRIIIVWIKSKDGRLQFFSAHQHISFSSQYLGFPALQQQRIGQQSFRPKQHILLDHLQRLIFHRISWQYLLLWFQLLLLHEQSRMPNAVERNLLEVHSLCQNSNHSFWSACYSSARLSMLSLVIQSNTADKLSQAYQQRCKRQNQKYRT